MTIFVQYPSLQKLWPIKLNNKFSRSVRSKIFTPSCLILSPRNPYSNFMGVKSISGDSEIVMINYLDVWHNFGSSWKKVLQTCVNSHLMLDFRITLVLRTVRTLSTKARHTPSSTSLLGSFLPTRMDLPFVLFLTSGMFFKLGRTKEIPTVDMAQTFVFGGNPGCCSKKKRLPALLDFFRHGVSCNTRSSTRTALDAAEADPGLECPYL